MSWSNELLGALQLRDDQEQATKDIFDNYAHLADRTAHLELKAAKHISSPQVNEKISRQSAKATPSSTTQMKHDLAEAQRSRVELQTRLDVGFAELESLRSRYKTESRHVMELNSEKSMLSMKLRDRDEELKGKAKLLEDLHDETAALILQLNLREEQNQKLKDENADLIRRWMDRMGKEADALNSASKFS